MYLAKLVNGSRAELFYNVTHTVVTNIEEDSKVVREGTEQPCIRIEIVEANRRSTTVVLPDDGEVLYVMNNEGKTVQTYRYKVNNDKVLRGGLKGGV